MWNSKNCAAMAIAGACLAGASATPANACFNYGYTGIFSAGWPYANNGFSSFPSYSYRSCGGSYNIQLWGQCNGYGPCGAAPFPPLIVTVPVEDRTAPVVAAPPAWLRHARR